MIEAAVQLQCDLCGLECGRAPLTRRFDNAEKHFCCLGCQNVYTILAESGIVASGQDLRETDVFRQSQKLGLISTRKEKSPRIPPGAVTTETVLRVSGMWCSSCGWLIEHALLKEPGIVSAEVLFASDLVRVTYCPQLLPPTRISERIESLG